jgi:solute carrier family 35 protein F1/2
MADTKQAIPVETTPADHKGPIVSTEAEGNSRSASISPAEGGHNGHEQTEAEPEVPADEIEAKKKGFFAYFRTRDFYIILILGYVWMRSKDPETCESS